jgi:phosphoribosylpyrophosphate synthetase
MRTATTTTDAGQAEVYGAPITTETVRRTVGHREYLLGATDAGRAKWVQSLACSLGVEPAFVYKAAIRAPERFS